MPVHRSDGYCKVLCARYPESQRVLLIEMRLRWMGTFTDIWALQAASRNKRKPQPVAPPTEILNRGKAHRCFRISTEYDQSTVNHLVNKHGV